MLIFISVMALGVMLGVFGLYVFWCVLVEDMEDKNNGKSDNGRKTQEGTGAIDRKSAREDRRGDVF